MKNWGHGPVIFFELSSLGSSCETSKLKHKKACFRFSCLFQRRLCLCKKCKLVHHKHNHKHQSSAAGRLLIILLIENEKIKSAARLTLAHITSLRKVVNTTILEQGPPNHKIDGGLCLHTPSSTTKDGAFITQPPLYPAVKNDNEIQTSLFLFI